MKINVKIFGISVEYMKKYSIKFKKGDITLNEKHPIEIDNHFIINNDKEMFITFELLRKDSIQYRCIIKTYQQEEILLIYNNEEPLNRSNAITCFYQNININYQSINISLKKNNISFNIEPKVLNKDKHLYFFYLLNFYLSYHSQLMNVN